MQVITLTTDMGTKDYYVASLKGAIFSALKEVQIVDVSHEILAFDVMQAAYQLGSCFMDFPVGTIHVMAVDSELSINFGAAQHASIPAIMLFKGHYFVSNDNGFFSLICGADNPEKIWHIDDVLSNPNAFRFPAKNILIPTACKIANGVIISDFASEVESYKKMFSFNAVLETNLIKGQITHIDHFGNAITNVSKELFSRIGENIPFIIYFRKKEYYIDEISKSYNEVPEGEKVAIFNNNNLLEIAMNRGATARNNGANTMFGLNVGDVVRIEFTPRGSKETIDSLF
jgi:S-adenosylmethionine hydrolase